MSNDITLIPASDVQMIATAIAKSNLFGAKTVDQALALCFLAQAEGMHPATAARDYDIIQGRPAKKAEAMLRDFMRAGGKVEWHKLDDLAADATFSHPAGGSVRISWDMKRAAAAGLGTKDMWKKYPRQMLRSRVVSEGVRTAYPLATSGMYVPEEVQDFDTRPARPAVVEVVDTGTGEITSTPSPWTEDKLEEAHEARAKGTGGYTAWWKAQTAEFRAAAVKTPEHEENKAIAIKATVEERA
jgi:hypothetical protein